jgi:hypothetical protein
MTASGYDVNELATVGALLLLAGAIIVAIAACNHPNFITRWLDRQ